MLANAPTNRSRLAALEDIVGLWTIEGPSSDDNDGDFETITRWGESFIRPSPGQTCLSRE